MKSLSHKDLTVKSGAENSKGIDFSRLTAFCNYGDAFGVRQLADNLAMVVSLEGANPSGKGLVSHPYPNPEVD
jgi:hypothetical protein